MTSDELTAEAARLKALHDHSIEGIHAFNNIVSIWQGEMDLAMRGVRKVVDGLQKTLDQFYEKFPEFREGELKDMRELG